MHLHILPHVFAVLKLNPNEGIPNWIQSENAFLSITYTEDEISIVCQQRFIPVDFQGEKETGWRAVKVQGMLDFSMTGILTALTIPLAEAQISVFSLSTYSTDYILLKDDMLTEAVSIWNSQGHEVTE